MKKLCSRDQERDIHYTTPRNYDISSKHILDINYFKVIPLIPCSQPLSALWWNQIEVQLLHKILFASK